MGTKPFRPHQKGTYSGKHARSAMPPGSHCRNLKPTPRRAKKRGVSLKGLVPLLLALLGCTVAALFISQSAHAATTLTIDQALGCTRTVQSVLKAHESDSYYLGTPYGNTGPNGEGGLKADWDCRWPNGSPKPGVGAYMNCAGFVSRVIMDAGGDVSGVATWRSFANGANPDYKSNDTNARKWYYWALDNGMATYRFSNKQEMLASGVLEKGDIIFIDTDRSIAGNDYHIGFFWGNTPSEDLFWHSSSSGDGLVAGSQPGNMISQITPKGTATGFLVIKTQHTVEVAFQKTSSEPSINTTGSLYSLAGATYEIHRAEDDAVVDTITTDADGKAALTLDAGGSYYAVETVPPKGFVLNPDRIAFTAGAGTTVELPDKPGTIALTIVKRDAATGGVAQPGASLEGAEYRVTDAHGKTYTTVTGKDGRARVEGIPLGTVKVVETKAPSGYRLDPTIHTYNVSAGDLPATGVIELEPESDFAEHPVAFDLRIVKYRDTGSEESGLQEPAEGVRFSIISNTTGKEVASIETDASGFATTEGAWYGSGERVEGINGALPYDQKGYTVREDPATTPEGFRPAGEWRIEPEEMVDGIQLSYIVDNDFVTSRLQIVKTDAETGLTVPLAGFTFQLLDTNKEPVTQEAWYPSHEELSEFTTDDSGTVTLPEALKPGTYYIRETATAPVYLLGQEDIEVTISNDGSTPAMTVMCVPNEQARGRAVITKRCSDAEGHDGDSILDAGCAGALEGAEFDVVAQQDIVSPDGTVRAVAGEVVDHVVTGEDGTATTDLLYLGSGSATYAFVETVAPAGHVLDSTPHEFTLAYVDGTTELAEVSIEATDTPTEVTLGKRVLGYEDALPGATFELWSAADELDITPTAGKAALAIAGIEGTEVSLRSPVAYAELEVNLPENMQAVLTADDTRVELENGAVTVDPGTYALAVTDAATDEAIDVGGDVELEIAADTSYRLTVGTGFFTGTTARLEELGSISELIEIPFDDNAGAYLATDLAAGTYQVLINGEAVAKTSLSAGPCRVLRSDNNEDFREVPALLAKEAEPTQLVTDEKGRIVIRHLGEGSYRLWESEAPEGFLTDNKVRYFTIDRNGLTEGLERFEIEVEDDFTKVDLSKRDITDESEVIGAHLAVLDEDGDVVEEWTSEQTDHRIEALAPGTYTLVELRTPHDYDEATAVTFTVEATGNVQRVVMYDEPIEISAQIDKRQQIADPTWPYTDADKTVDEGGTNNAPVTASEDGSYSYTVDFRSTSTTWVDEFTVTDELHAAEDGLAELVSLTTPTAGEDYDGKLNVWYRTNKTPEDFIDPTTANATLDDGHANPWLTDEATAAKLGDDGRAVSYAGWELWEQDVDATTPTELDTGALRLDEDEHIIAVRLEYGRVEKGFTTRKDEWDRPLLKDAYDDVAEIATSETGSPLILHMRVTNAYRADTELENEAAVEAYRNGGNIAEHEHLEDRDDDRVVQKPRERTPEIDTCLVEKESGGHQAVTGHIELIDTVTMRGLEAGVEHTLTGTLHDRETGEALLDTDGNALSVNTTFIPSKSEATMEVGFSVDATELAGKHIVAFEELSIEHESPEEGNETRIIAQHADLDDADQTVSVQIDASELPRTGIQQLWPFLMSVALTAGIALAIRHIVSTRMG